MSYYHLFCSQRLDIAGAKPNCICLCGLKFKHENEDKCPGHLKNWELWMQRRKRTHETLIKKLDRGRTAAGDLLMNSADIVCRNIKEEKLVLHYSKIETRFDKYRGNPYFWKLPYSLKSQTEPRKGTEYFAVSTSEEKNEIPVIEYIGVPDFILQEKDLVPRTRYLKNIWCKSSYRQQVVARASKKILEIAPHKPDFSNLIILGSNCVAPNKISAESGESKATSIEEKQSTETLSINEGSKVFCKLSLKINNTEFSDLAYNTEDKISIIFEYFIGSHYVSCQREIIFENTGQVVLRIYWTPYKKFKIFREYTDTHNSIHPFYFNKNEIVLLPGIRKELPIWFRVNKPGNFIEHWEITTLPKIWNSGFRLIISLKGMAFINEYEHRMQHLSEMLLQRVRNTTINDLLNDILSKGNYCLPDITRPFSFTEKGLFEGANLVAHIGTQLPKYIYNPVVIAELKDFYKTNKSPDDPKEWNLSIETLREIARKRDLFSYFENKLVLYKTAKLRRQALHEHVTDRQNPSEIKYKGGTKKQAEKIDKVLDPVCSPVEKTHLNCYHNLKEILQKLEKPSIYVNRERTKFFLCYLIIRTLLWKVFDEIYKLDNHSTEIIERQPQSVRTSSLLQIPDRLLYEKFDESNIVRTKRISHIADAPNAKPKSLLLKGISTSEVKKVFKTYFGKDETNQKGKTSARESKKSGHSKGQKNKSTVSEEEDHYLVDDDFNPFEEFHSEREAAVTVRGSFPDTNYSLTKDVDENKYLMVYLTLCDIVSLLVDTVEANKEENIPSDTLGELKRCEELFTRKSSQKLTNMNVHEPKGSSLSCSDSDYFDFLQNRHWQNNPNTKKYYISERLKSNTNSTSELDIETRIKESILNMFSLEDFKRQSYPYCLKETAAQTEVVLEIGDSKSELDRKISAESVEESKKIFYFLDENTE